jgi:hypothetical protein
MARLINYIRRYYLSEEHRENEVMDDLLFIGKKILSDY